MENPKKDEINQIKEEKETNNVKINNNNNNDLTYESYLQKKGRNIFAGWQKRYFICLEGKLIIYTDSKENKQVKGYIPIKKICNVKPLEQNNFIIEAEDRTYLLKAENQTIKNTWIEKIKYFFTFVKKGSLQENSSSQQSSKSITFISKNDDKDKLKTISRKLYNIIIKNGYILNIEETQTKQYLEKFGINKLINLNDSKILTHIHYGFMFKKQKLHESYNKRWFFILSRSSLKNGENNINKDDFLDEKKQKEWIKFDTLYYFRPEKDINEFENNNNVFDAEIRLDECHKIINFEKDGKFFMNLDYRVRIYEFYCETKMERDEWFDILVNSRKIAKTYKFSITKHPKNVDNLYNIFMKDKKSYIEKINAEKISVIGNINEISEFKVFEFTIQNFENLIESTMDGCLCSLPIKIELLKFYSEYMNKEYLNVYKIYWDKYYDKINKHEIIRIGLMLLNFYDRVNKFFVDDINLLNNGKELVKIYFKNVFPNILYSIENMVKYEIEHKGSKNGEGIYYSDGPKIFFDIFWKIFDLVKNFEHKIIFSLLLKIFNMAIFQFYFGINCVLSNRGIIIEDEYLITVSNDTFTMNELINSFIDQLKARNVLTEEEINEEVQIKKIFGLIDKICFNAIIHLVYEYKDELEKEFEEQKFLNMEIEKMITKSGQIYARFKSMMNIRVTKIFYNEILKLTLCYYLTRLLLINKKKKRKREEIIDKINKDKEIFFDTYKEIIGENLTISTLKILDDIVGILEIDKSMISTTILTIRQYIGPAFTYSVAEKLIKLRSDLTNDEKKDCKSQSEEVLNNYEGPKGESSSYFQILSSIIKKNNKDKEYKKIRASQLKFGNEIDDENKIDKEWEEGNKINNDNEEDDLARSVQINVDNEENYIKVNLEDFLKDNDDEKEDYNEDEEEEDDDIKQDKEEDSKIDYEGFFYKRSNSSYKKYYYQIKNCGLYWFENQKSTKPKNKLSLKDATIINNDKELNKFSLKLKEKDVDKEYKFKCNLEEEKNALIKAMTKVINNSKNMKEGIDIPTIEIKERKKVIKDYFQTKNKLKANYIEERVFDYLKTGKYFKINKDKMEKAIKTNKEKKKKEKEIEKMKGKEKDGKPKHKKLKSKIKNWFKDKIKGKNDDKK